MRHQRISRVVPFFISDGNSRIKGNGSSNDTRFFILTVSQRHIVVVITADVERQSGLYVLGNLLIQVYFCGEALHFIILHYAGVVEVVDRSHIFCLFRSTVYRNIMLVHKSGTCDFVKPGNCRRVEYLVVRVSGFKVRRIIIRNHIILVNAFSFFFQP